MEVRKAQHQKRGVQASTWLSWLGEPLIEWLIWLCGWSAILFVFAIFFFVFREGAPFLVS